MEGGTGAGGGKLGNVNFHVKSSDYFRTNIELPFLKYFLKGDGQPALPKAYVFETGTDQWRRYDAWPPPKAREKSLYFHSGGRLSFDRAANEAAEYDEYVSDPAKPVPYIPGIAIGMTREHMTDDQRFAAARPDVVVYQTEVL